MNNFTHGKNLYSPVTKFKEAVPSDSIDLKQSETEFYPRSIMVTSGDVALDDEDGDTITFTDGVLATGVWLPMRPTKIRATGTTATVYVGE